jgi:general secretion pathway protein I
MLCFRRYVAHLKAFTLLETVIALAILGAVLGVMINIFTESLDRIQSSGKATFGVVLAQSLLDQAGQDVPLQRGEKSGVFEGGYQWHLRTEPYGEALDRQAWEPQPYLVSAIVSWQGEGPKNEVTLKTIHLSPMYSEGRP